MNTGDGSFSFKGDVVDASNLTICNKPLTLQTRVNVQSTVDSATGVRSFSGHLEADFMVGAAVFVLAFDFGQATTITGSWNSNDGTTFGLEDLVNDLNLAGMIDIPDGLDLALVQAELLYNVTNSYFTLSARSRTYGDAFFTAGTGAGGWGFVFGVTMPQVGKLSDIPVIGSELGAADFITFNGAGIIIASATFTNYTIPNCRPFHRAPGTAAHRNPRSGSRFSPSATTASCS